MSQILPRIHALQNKLRDDRRALGAPSGPLLQLPINSAPVTGLQPTAQLDTAPAEPQPYHPAESNVLRQPNFRPYHPVGGSELQHLPTAFENPLLTFSQIDSLIEFANNFTMIRKEAILWTSITLV